MCDAWQEEDVVHAVYHERAEEKAHYPPLVLCDVALQCSIDRPPAGEKHKRDEQMRGAHAEQRTLRRATVDEKRNNGSNDYERQKHYAKRPMPTWTLPAEQQEPRAEDKCGDDGHHVRLDDERCMDERFDRHRNQVCRPERPDAVRNRTVLSVQQLPTAPSARPFSADRRTWVAIAHAWPAEVDRERSQP